MISEPSSEGASAEPGLLAKAKHGIIWSIVQNWGGKLLAFGLSILLARLLNPTEFGIASAASLVLMLIPLIADTGMEAQLNTRFYCASADDPIWRHCRSLAFKPVSRG